MKHNVMICNHAEGWMKKINDITEEEVKKITEGYKPHQEGEFTIYEKEDDDFFYIAVYEAEEKDV